MLFPTFKVSPSPQGETFNATKEVKGRKQREKDTSHGWRVNLA